MTWGGGEGEEGNAELSVYKYNQKHAQFLMPLTCQACAHTKLLPDAVPHAISVSVQIDPHLKIVHALEDLIASLFGWSSLT